MFRRRSQAWNRGLRGQFATEAGRRYCVEYCTDLVKADWTVISDSIPGTGKPIAIIGPATTTTAPRGFYRIRLKNP